MNHKLWSWGLGESEGDGRVMRAYEHNLLYLKTYIKKNHLTK